MVVSHTMFAQGNRRGNNVLTSYLQDFINNAVTANIIPTDSLASLRVRKSHHSQLFDHVGNIFATSRAFLNSDLSPSSSVFLLKIHFYSIVLRPSSSSSKVYTLFSYMDPLSDFMASSHSSEFGPTIASP